jgi:diacylglycerol kinase
MSLEAINTTIEGVLDFVYPKEHKTIGNTKDISSVAILISDILNLL